MFQSRSTRRLRSVFAAAVLAAAVTSLAMAAGVFADRGTGEGGGEGLSVKDRLDILDLYSRYSQALDNGNADEFATNVFAPNGTFHDPSVCAVGTQQLRELAPQFGEPLQERHEQHLPYRSATSSTCLTTSSSTATASERPAIPTSRFSPRRPTRTSRAPTPTSP
jgi:hypothetical protein